GRLPSMSAHGDTRGRGGVPPAGTDAPSLSSRAIRVASTQRAPRCSPPTCLRMSGLPPQIGGVFRRIDCTVMLRGIPTIQVVMKFTKRLVFVGTAKTGRSGRLATAREAVRELMMETLAPRGGRAPGRRDDQRAGRGRRQ